MTTLTTWIRGKRGAAWAAIFMSVPLLGACGGYYQVTDTGSGKSYYTRDVDRNDGHAEFIDRATGDEVTLDNFEMREVTRQQYKNAVRK